jgi:hypothetical protein
MTEGQAQFDLGPDMRFERRVVEIRFGERRFDEGWR